MHMCSMRCPLEATQLGDVEILQAAPCLTIYDDPTLRSTRSANKRPDLLQGVLWYYRTIGPGLVQRTYFHVRYSPDQKTYTLN